MALSVLYSPEALRDLLLLYAYIDGESGPDRARAYTARIEGHCAGLAEFPERGRRRDDLRPGLRIIGFERRATIAFHVSPAAVIIDRILYGGRELDTAVGEDGDQP